MVKSSARRPKRCACGCGEFAYSKKAIAKRSRHSPIFRKGHEQDLKACPVCCEAAGPESLLHLECGCVSCVSCVSDWVSAKAENGEAERMAVREAGFALTIPCGLSAACDGQPIAPSVLSLTPAGRALQDRLALLKRLRTNKLYPPSVQVPCRDPNCLGIGYLGGDTVMCFVCYDQYAAPQATTVREDGSAYVKKCPRCKVHVQKDGGCDHMACTRCGHDFNWSEVSWSMIDTKMKAAPSTPPTAKKAAKAKGKAKRM